MKYVPLNQIFQKLEDLEQKLLQQHVEFLDVEETAKHLKLKKSYLYLLVHRNQIPFYKPNGKKIYFAKAELNAWILKSKRKSNEEVEEEYKNKNNHLGTSSLDNIQISADLSLGVLK